MPDHTKKVTKTMMNNFALTAITQVRKTGNAMLNLLFPCHHRSISVPFTPIFKPGQPPAATYVTCFDCGAKFHYDWVKMRIGKSMPKPTHAYSHTHFQALDKHNSNHGLNARRV